MKRLLNGVIVLFLGIQILLPLRGLLTDKHDSRGNFSWNMYSQQYGCQSAYLSVAVDGTIESVIPEVHFNRPGRIPMVYHRDTLPELHRYLCDTLEAEGRPRDLRGSVACRLNRGDRIDLIQETGNLCTATNFGVGAGL